MKFRVSAPAGGRAHAAAPARPATALRAARSRLLQPGTRRDIRARIPTPGLFLGVRPRPDRNSFFAARVRTARAPRCPSAGLASPFLSASSLSSPSRSPLRAGFSSRWVLKGLPWARRGCRQGESRRLHSYRRSTRAWGGGDGGLCFSGWVRRQITRHRKEMTAAWRRGRRLERSSL